MAGTAIDPIVIDDENREKPLCSSHHSPVPPMVATALEAFGVVLANYVEERSGIPISEKTIQALFSPSLREARKCGVQPGHYLSLCAWMLTNAGFGITCVQFIKTHSLELDGELAEILGEYEMLHLGIRPKGANGVGLHVDQVPPGGITKMMKDMDEGENHYILCFTNFM